MHLVVEEGPNRGARVPLVPGDLTLGCAPTSDLRLGGEAAARHARIVVGAVAAVITSLVDGSETWVNGLPLEGSVRLSGGDRVRLAGTVISLAEGPGAPIAAVSEPPATYGAAVHPSLEHAGAPCPRSRAPVEIVARTPIMAEVVATLRKVASGDTTVLLVGESGTGKEVAARAIQANGPRARRPFVTVNAAALSEGLLESELFGHERGAFTGAIARRSGVFELAHGGTLFLDEIGEISPAMQAKLLRVLETGEIRRVGGNETREFDVRLITATNRNLRARVREGGFREDLYYRLAVVQIEIPPLRARRADLVPICDQLLRALAADRGIPVPMLEDGALERLRAYRFPGNIRELRNALERALLLGNGLRVHERDLPPEIQAAGREAGGEPPLLPLAEVERRHIAAALRLTGWNKKRAAEILGVARKTLYLKIETHALRPDDAGAAEWEGAD